MMDSRNRLVAVAAALLISVAAFGQEKESSAPNSTMFTPGNLVVAVEGCGVHAGTCTNVPNGTGTGTGNSSNGGYGDNQAAPLTFFQYTPSGTASATFVNSLVLPQSISGANFSVSGEYGSSSEATLNLSGVGQYLTILGYGIDALSFNANPATYGSAGSLAQSGSLTGQSYTAVPRVLTLIDANGNVNSATAIYNVFNENNPRSAFTVNGTTGYVSGQGTGTDATGGVFYIPVLGVSNSAPTAITGLDASSKTIAQDTRDVQILNNTLYVSADSKEGSGNNRSFIGTLGDPPATSLYNNGSGQTMLTGFGNTGGTGKVTITTGANSDGNNLNAGMPINLSPVNYFFASTSVLYVADSGDPKNDSNGDNNSNGTANIGDGGLQKWVNSKSDGTGTWSLAYTLYQGLDLVNNGSADGTSGLYGLTGTVSGNNVYLYATNYTLNDLDYTYLYGITDNLTYTTASQAASETFTTLDTAPADSNFKGVSFAPTIPAGDVEVTSSPSGLSFTSAGTGCAPGTYTTPITLTWTPASSCTLSVVTPQSGGTGIQYVFSQWQDGTTGTSDTVTAPTTTATYTPTFTANYQLTTAAGTGGTVSPGGYYASGSDAIVTATPNSGYYFVNFTGTTNSTQNPLTILMNSPQSVTANFAQIQSQTITCSTPPPASAANGSSFTLACAATSGLAIVYTSSGSCTNVGATYTMSSGSGTCGVYVNQPGNSQYSPASTVSYSVNATQATTTINVTNVSPSSEDYGADSPVTITAVLSWAGNGAAPTASDVVIGGNGPSGYSATSCGAPSGDTMTCTASYTPTAADGAGTYTETAAFSGDANYGSSSSPQTNNFAINGATTSTSVVGNPNPSTYAQQVVFTASISSENNNFRRHTTRGNPLTVTGSVTWSSNTGCAATPVTPGANGTATATCTTSSATHLPVGTDVVTATYSGDSNHSGSMGSENQVVNGGIPTTINVTNVSPSAEDYGADTPVTITAVLSWTGYGTAPTSSDITIGGNGNGSYGATSCSPRSGETITCTATYTPTAADGAGSYTETASFSGDTNYGASSSPQTNNFVINNASSTTSVGTSGSPTTYGNSVTFTASISSENNNFRRRTTRGNPLDVTGTVSWSGDTGCSPSPVTSGANGTGTATCTTTTLPVGTNTITATYSGDSNHSGSTGTLSGGQVVNQASQTISFTTPPPASAGYEASFTVVATASSGLPVVYSHLGDCSNTAGGTYTMLAASGQCEIVVNQPGNSNYSAAPQLSGLTNETKATPTASFTGAPATAPYQSTFTVTATINDGVTPTITTSNACSISGTTVTMLTGAGTCTVTAKWAATTDYNSVTMKQTTTGEKLVPVVNWATSDPITYGTALSGTQLDATATYNSASVPGTFKYTPASGKVLTVGLQTLSVTFTPTMSTDYTTATGSVQLTVNQAATTTSITKTIPVTPKAGEATKVDVSVTGAYGHPTGTVTVNSSGGQTCTVTLVSGGGNCSMTFPADGPYTLTGTYSGDSNNLSSTSAGFALTVSN